MPLKEHENVLVFYDKLPTYNPIKTAISPRKVKRTRQVNSSWGEFNELDSEYTDEFPRTIIFSASQRGKHPTQKPVALMEYLIKTYTNENDLVLDNTMGSGTTAVACINTNRRFVGIEKEEKYFDICIQRCTDAIMDSSKKAAA